MLFTGLSFLANTSDLTEQTPRQWMSSQWAMSNRSKAKRYIKDRKSQSSK